MSSTTSRRVIAAVLLTTVSTAEAHAAVVECPAIHDGHRLARLDGGSLYQGDPADNVLLAPTNESPGGRGVNVWTLPDPVGIVLVCQYEGTRAQVVLRLSADVHTCRQSTERFSCQ